MIQDKDTDQDEKIIAHVDIELKELIPGFLDNRRKDIQSILKALEQGNYETARILGHSMKGSGAGYGFAPITDIGRSIEQAAQIRNPEEIRKWVAQLLNYISRVEIVYE
jgi:HPt (histidine-containing phosphotransfer) domain-containing protein